MIKDFKLPDLGEGLTESEIVKWQIAVGDTVELNQVIAEVETAKAVVDLPSPFAGKVTALHEDEGATVQVGAPIVSIDVTEELSGDDAAKPVPAADGADAGQESKAGNGKPERQSVLVGYGPAAENDGRPKRRARGAARSAAAAPVEQTVQGAADQGTTGAVEQASSPTTAKPAERPRSTPPVRKLAKDLGVDLTQLEGTGKDGLITRQDVQAFADGGAAEPAQAGAAPADRRHGEREVRIPIKGVRKHTAAAMVKSAFTAPHVSEFLTVDVTPTMELLAKLKASRAFAGYKLTPLTILSKALMVALARNPSLNSRWDEANGEIVQMSYVNLGIAAATPRGLVVPNIKDAEQLSLTGLATALTDLTETARAGKTSPENLSGGTISITNIGVFGIDAGTPILNPGEAAILAMGAVRRQPWEYQGEVGLREVMTLSLSFDHRMVDGEQGSRFLADIGAILAEPGMILTMI
ncbi:dihydrolipoamide acetyltransferase family protein [Arthrobacter sp. H14]|uniref:dihydrolipoamide acetyltransferase family protein n=1 Tax=Arthrobacter sp. H14 TaxID=1312959 RepID=UPI00047B0D28|nr:dihydrolipoamide acetyltransferase family protein [Arthrobacter sp. H14]